MQFVDKELTATAQAEPKYKLFKEWLLANGAIFDDLVEYPCVFDGGLMGICAKQPIKRCKAFISIPNNLIISQDRCLKETELHQVWSDNPHAFSKAHPDGE